MLIALVRRLPLALGLFCLGLAPGISLLRAGTVKFDIPAQPAADALLLFSKQSGADVLYSHKDLNGVRSRAVVGEYEPDAAIGLLLRDTGWSYRRDSGKFVITQLPVSTKSGAISGSLISPPHSRPIAGALVRVSNTDIETTSNSQGVFRLANVPPGYHVLRVSSEAIRPAKIVGVAVAPGETTRLDALEIPIPGPDGSLEMKEIVVDATTLGSGAVRLESMEVSSTKVTGIVNQGIIPREEDQAVRYQVISREDIDRTGLTSLPELMRRVTANQETGTTSQRTFALSVNATGNFLGSGDLVNLRGMGNGQTLVMINGRRLYGSDSSGADINRIPLAAVERVEILPSSGSAIYGANSGAGVVNIIMRSGFRGSEINTYVGASTNKGAEEFRFDLFHGMSFNQGRTNATLSLNYGHQNELTRGERDYDQRILNHPALQPGLPGFNSVVLPMIMSRRTHIITTSPLGLGIPSNPTATFAVVPAGSDGVGLTPASFNTTAAQAAITTDRLSRSKLRNSSTNKAVILNLDHALFGDALGAYTELTWRQEKVPVIYPSAGGGIFSLTATDPRNPFRTGVTPGFVGRAIQIYRDPTDLPDDEQFGIRETLRAVAGFKGRWDTASGRQYTWSVDGSWDRNTAEVDSLVSTAAMTVASQNGLYNLFRDMTNVRPLSASEAARYSYRSLSLIRPTVIAGNARFNGDLFPLWGGPAKFSLVGERRQEQYLYNLNYTGLGEYLFLPGSTLPTSLVSRTVTNTRRNFFAAAGEVVLPFVGERNRRPWLHSLDLSAGARYEKNTGFFAATPPLAAVKIGVTRDLAVRVAYQEGFQPPTLSSLTNPVSTGQGATNYVDALRPGLVNSYTLVSSGNAELRPETSKTWDVGVILTPRWFPRFNANFAYFRYDKQDVVSTLSLTDAIVYYPQLVVRDAPSADDTAARRPGPINTYYSRPVNLARQFTDGVDVSLRYQFAPTPWGRFTVTGDGTWTKRFFTQTLPNSPKVNGMGVAPLSSNFVLERRTSGTVIWSRDVWSASVTGFYVGSFESSTTAPSVRNPTGSGIDGARIAGALTFDVQVGYSIPYRQGGKGLRGVLNGTKWSVGALNVLDKEPAMWADRIRGFYSPFVDPRQRYAYLMIRKTL